MRNISLIQQMLHFADQDWADSSLHFNVEGSLIRPGEHVQPVPRAGQFLQEECHWVISPPPHRMLRLTVDTSNIRNGECQIQVHNGSSGDHISLLLVESCETDWCISVSCAGWQLRVWTEDKQTGARDSVDRMCGQDQRREYTIPQVYGKLVHITIHGVHTSHNNYSIHWQAQGLLLPDTLHYQVGTREFFLKWDFLKLFLQSSIRKCWVLSICQKKSWETESFLWQVNYSKLFQEGDRRQTTDRPAEVTNTVTGLSLAGSWLPVLLTALTSSIIGWDLNQLLQIIFPIILLIWPSINLTVFKVSLPHSCSN